MSENFIFYSPFTDAHFSWSILYVWFPSASLNVPCRMIFLSFLSYSYIPFVAFDVIVVGTPAVSLPKWIVFIKLILLEKSHAHTINSSVISVSLFHAYLFCIWYRYGDLKELLLSCHLDIHYVLFYSRIHHSHKFSYNFHQVYDHNDSNNWCLHPQRKVAQFLLRDKSR